MASDFQAFSLSGCFTGNFDETGLSGSVGKGGRNSPADVKHVQRLLNEVPPAQGGAQPQLEIDGIAGPLTLAAITRFQATLGARDGRVDPNGPTFVKLEVLAAANSAIAGALGKQPSASPSIPGANSSQAQASRRQLAISVMPDASRALAKTLRELDQIRLRTLVGGTPLLPSPKSEQVLNRHFATSGLPVGTLRTSLTFIQATFAKMQAILAGRKGFFGGDPFGPNIIEADPIPPPLPPILRNAFAYSPNTTADKRTLAKLGISPSRLYFTSRIDGRSRDFFLYALLHELAHFVDDERVAQIGDHAYGFENKYLTLSHAKRKLNAECYGLLAFELFAGNARLALIHPNLRVIDLDPVVIT